MFFNMREKRFEYRYATEEELEELKQREFSGWMLTYVSAGMTRGETFDDWIREMVRGPEYVGKSYPKFCTRRYAFTTQKRRRSSTTYDAGVCSASGDDVYYGNIREIMEIKYPGMVGLRCTVFYCVWYDNTPDRVVRTDAVGVTSVHSRRKLQYYDPFILASQADHLQNATNDSLERVFKELHPHFLSLASNTNTNTYAVHVLKKMLDGAAVSLYIQPPWTCGPPTPSHGRICCCGACIPSGQCSTKTRTPWRTVLNRASVIQTLELNFREKYCSKAENADVFKEHFLNLACNCHALKKMFGEVSKQQLLA
ncbi:hypothetical protein DY000_02050341 [Brassica cretica]|uniref:DUF4216 domain-containing protein n=1 Tax=Brassica cretica TaxID=69181 RepID=A0ABQ7ETI8_BRACR|nr:hypothetical protein DY000_02050341 [Brassica cretica]